MLPPMTSSTTTPTVLLHNIFEGITGSRAYGLESNSSDEDRRSIFAYDTDRFWGLDQPKPTLEPSQDWTMWEIAHFLRMLRKGSVNAFELLWLPADCLISFDEDSWLWLMQNRTLFFTESLWKGWNGVITGHRHEYEKMVRNGAPFHKQAKEASHILRLALGLQVAVKEREMVLRFSGVDLTYLRGVKFCEEQVTVDNALRLAALAQDKAYALYSDSPWASDFGGDILDRFLVARRREWHRKGR